ncbi:MAG: YggT family protein [Candidatus Omnitrophica bacterium]|nr:YggT family protein [Candidatus Omnitrophota bacterium]
MFVFGNFLIALAKIVDTALTVYYWLILARAVISWVSPDPFNPIVQFLYRVTEPVLAPVRRILGIRSGIDFSPLLVFLAIFFLKSFLVTTLIEAGLRMKGA